MVVGCSTDPGHLKASSRDLRLDLAEPLIYESGSSGPMRFERALAAGTYRAIAEDAGGVFLHGPGSCYSVKVLDPGSALKEELRGKVWTTMDCGIYLPNNAAAPAKIYVVLGTASPPPSALGESNAALLVSVLSPGASTIQGSVGVVHTGFAALEAGNFNFVPSPPRNALRERLGR
jgi:hypothetical protein